MKIKKRKLPRSREACFEWGYESGAIALSKLLDDHPENWDGPCICAECMSYAGQE